jgi:hypothetical protein
VVELNGQSGAAEDLAAWVLIYALRHYRWRVPVHSIIIVLRQEADHPNLIRRLRYQGRKRKGKMDFTDEVVRMWEQALRRYLRGGLGTLPLAPLAGYQQQLPSSTLRPVVRRIVHRLDRDAEPGDRAKPLSATYVLTGLRVSREIADQLFPGVHGMKKSSTYQAILERVHSLLCTTRFFVWAGAASKSPRLPPSRTLSLPSRMSNGFNA